MMEKITSRKNPYIAHVRALAADAGYRGEHRQFLCDGIKTLREALAFNAQVVSVLWKEQAQELPGLNCREQYLVPADLFDYASPMKNSPGPLFCVAYREVELSQPLQSAVVLETVQDPGNVGTVIRTANALGISAVILTGDCADYHNPKTVRASMGAVFRQQVLEMDRENLYKLLKTNNLPLYGTALHIDAKDIRKVDIKHAAVAIGSEGQGLSAELMAACDGLLVIPMQPDSESLNAAVAAGLVMWEMAR